MKWRSDWDKDVEVFSSGFIWEIILRLMEYYSAIMWLNWFEFKSMD